MQFFRMKSHFRKFQLISSEVVEAWQREHSKSYIHTVACTSYRRLLLGLAVGKHGSARENCLPRGDTTRAREEETDFFFSPAHHVSSRLAIFVRNHEIRTSGNPVCCGIPSKAIMPTEVRKDNGALLSCQGPDSHFIVACRVPRRQGKGKAAKVLRSRT